MYNKILVPLDGSGNSECVLDHVRTIASGCHVANILLITVIEPLPLYYLDFRVSEEIIREGKEGAETEAKKYLTKMADKLAKQGLSVSIAVVNGKPAETILDFALKNGIDLIIMATHGRTGISRWALGSTTDKVVRESNVPVMVIAPEGCRVKV